MKSEARRPKAERRPKSEDRNPRPSAVRSLALGLRPSAFGFNPPSVFGFQGGRTRSALNGPDFRAALAGGGFSTRSLRNSALALRFRTRTKTLSRPPRVSALPPGFGVRPPLRRFSPSALGHPATFSPSERSIRSSASNPVRYQIIRPSFRVLSQGGSKVGPGHSQPKTRRTKTLKPEARRPKEGRGPKSEDRNPRPSAVRSLALGLRVSDFFRPSTFGLRI